MAAPTAPAAEPHRSHADAKAQINLARIGSFERNLPASQADRRAYLEYVRGLGFELHSWAQAIDYERNRVEQLILRTDREERQRAEDDAREAAEAAS